MNCFQTAMNALNNSASAGKPVQVADAREAALNKALQYMGAELGVLLEPLRIDARGEISIVAIEQDAERKRHGTCGHYGEAFAHWLSQIPTRTGVTAPHHPREVLPTNGWCWINHFEAERLVRQYAAYQTAQTNQAAG